MNPSAMITGSIVVRPDDDTKRVRSVVLNAITGVFAGLAMRRHCTDRMNTTIEDVR
jgi:hypothetical protein